MKPKTLDTIDLALTALFYLVLPVIGAATVLYWLAMSGWFVVSRLAGLV